MTKTLTIFLFLIISQGSSAQVNFFQTGARWGYSSIEHPDTPWDPYRTWLEQTEITGDTVINSLSYKKLYNRVKETFMPVASVILKKHLNLLLAQACFST